MIKFLLSLHSQLVDRLEFHFELSRQRLKEKHVSDYNKCQYRVQQAQKIHKKVQKVAKLQNYFGAKLDNTDIEYFGSFKYVPFNRSSAKNTKNIVKPLTTPGFSKTDIFLKKIKFQAPVFPGLRCSAEELKCVASY